MLKDAHARFVCHSIDSHVNPSVHALQLVDLHRALEATHKELQVRSY